MSTSTVVSVFPFPTTEIKPGLARGYFNIPACKDGDVVVYHVEDSFFTLRLPATDQHVDVPQNSITIARSIIRDFCLSHVCATGEAHPGMFFLDGKISKAEVKLKHSDKLEEITAKQIRWFEELVKQAESDWNRFHHQGLISDIQRYAAKALNFPAEWLVNYNPNEGTKDCPVCYNKMDSRAIKCGTCGAILDMKKAAEYGLITPKELTAVK